MTASIYREEDKSALPFSAKRALGDDPVPAPGHTRAHVPADYRQVNGWGADLDPANRPSYPKELPSTVTTVRGDVGARQVPHMKIYQSIEHADLTPVFGTSCPSTGLSALLRDYAYQFSEASNRHWMTLMMANRVNVLEGLLSGPFQGRPDNYIREKGWSAKFKYADAEQRRTYMTVGGAALGAVALIFLVNRALRDD